MKRMVLGITTLALLLSGCGREEPNGEPIPSEEESENITAPEEAEMEELEDASEEEELDESENNNEEAENEIEVPEAYGVNAGHPDAVDAGMEILEDGGNAVDAAIAAAYAVSVVEPFASGVGGGGVTLIQEQGEEPEAYDYREVVPEEGIPATNIGVPGFVAGTVEMYEDYGGTDWQTLLDPAIELAISSEVSETLAQQLQSAQANLPVEQLNQFYPGGVPVAAGAELEQAELAETLQEISESGGEVFYEGTIAESLSDIEGLSMASLSNFSVGRHEPVSGEFGEYEVIGAPPPLPGANVIQMLQIVEERGILDQERNSTPFIHNIAMSWRIARKFIETDLGDPSFVDIPVEQLTDSEQNAALAEDISSDSLLPANLGLSYQESDSNTTHITAVDQEGTVVSMTNTLTDFFGSNVYTEGFFLNNQMARFDIGQTGQNVPEPGRRSVTWSSPMLVADGDGPVMGIGSPGGERIPIMLTQVLSDWVAGGSELEAIVNTPRFHLTDNTLIMEEPVGPGQRNELLGIGYSNLSPQPTALYFGSIQALAIDRENGEIIGAADPRREADWLVETVD